MLKQVIYNYVDLDGTIWNTTNDGGIENTSTSSVEPTNNQLVIETGSQLKRLSLQARPGTFFEFNGTKLMITNSGIFNYEGQATNLKFYGETEAPKWFILDFETEDKV